MVVYSLVRLSSIVCWCSCTPLIALTFQLPALKKKPQTNYYEFRADVSKSPTEEKWATQGVKRETKARTDDCVWDRDRGGQQTGHQEGEKKQNRKLKL